MSVESAAIILVVTVSLVGLSAVAYVVMDIIEKIRDWRRRGGEE